MSTITYNKPEVEVVEEEVAEVEEELKEDEKPLQELLSLPKEEIERILAEEEEERQSRPRLPPDPCLLEYSSEDFEEEPVCQYQDSMDAAGYPYW